MKNLKTTRNNYDRLSRWYDMLSGFGEKRIKLYGLQKLNVQPGECILDIGCGTGDMLVMMGSSVGVTGRAYGIDLSPGMLNVAKSRVRSSGISNRILLMQGDGLALPFTHHKVDAIFMSFTLELFDALEIKEVLRSAKNVLNQTGRVCILYLSERAQPSLTEKLYVWMHQQWPALIDCRPIQLLKTLQDEGFRVIDSGFLSMWGLVVEVVVAVSAD